MNVPANFSRLNRLLAKKEPYGPEAWQHQPFHRRCLILIENILRQLEDTGLLPAEHHDGLVVWLLHHAPLTQNEVDTVRTFAFEIDYY